MPPRDPSEPNRQATQLELFFDLVCVIAIASFTAAFHHAISEGHGLHSVPKFAFFFLATWWIWMNFTWFASAFDNGDVVYRLQIISMMSGAIVFAGGASVLFSTADFGISLIGWVLMRLSLMSLWWRAGHTSPEIKAVARRYFWGLGAVQLLWILVYFYVPAQSVLFWPALYIAMGCEVAVPLIAEIKKQTPWHRHHIIERFGLLHIIVLGEVLLSVAIVVAAMHDEQVTFELLTLMIAGLLIVFSLWWIYFAEDNHLASAKLSTVFIWAYLHAFIFGAASAIGAGLAAYFDILQGDGGLTRNEAIWFIGAPAAIYIFALWLARDIFLPLGKGKFVLPITGVGLLTSTILGYHPIVLGIILTLGAIFRAPIETKS